MPNLQASLTDDEYVELVGKARLFGVSAGQFAKLLVKAYLRGDGPLDVDLSAVQHEATAAKRLRRVPRLFND